MDWIYTALYLYRTVILAVSQLLNNFRENQHLPTCKYNATVVRKHFLLGGRKPRKALALVGWPAALIGWSINRACYFMFSIA